MLTNEDIKNVIDSNNLVLLQFTADWCKSCKNYEYFINDLDVPVQKIDRDMNEDLIEEYEIQKLPTILVYKDKNLVDRIEQFIPKTEFVKRLGISSQD